MRQRQRTKTLSPRHTASQIFGSQHPALSAPAREADNKQGIWRCQAPHLPSKPHQLQPQACQLFEGQQPSQAPQYMPSFTTATLVPLTLSPFTDSLDLLAATFNPMMPVRGGPLRTANNDAPPTSMPVSRESQGRNVSVLHPVFFAETLQRSPFVLNAAAVLSPVAYGYAIPEVDRKYGVRL